MRRSRGEDAAAARDGPRARHALRAALDENLLVSLRYASLGIAVLYVILVLTSPALPARVVAPVASVETVIVLAAVGVHAACRRDRVPARFAHPVAMTLVTLILVDVALHMTLRHEPGDTVNLMLLALGVGFLFTSRAWFALALALTAGTWALAVVVHGPAPEWREFGFALFEAFVLAVIVFAVRLRTLARIERLRAADAARQRALEAANTDLEAFTGMASHDLRAPLRGVEYVLRALEEDYGRVLGADGRELVARGQREVERMRVLVEDLLAHARATRQEVNVDDVDVTALARRVTAALAERDPDRSVSVLVEDGLVARADPTLLRVVLENLLGNAWKFTSRTRDARIRVERAEWDGEPAIVVRDNGAGFPPERADHLFRPFERLHARHEFEGTGLGLATVRRIIERHGGRIRADGREGEGAAFTFTLPGKVDDESARGNA